MRREILCTLGPASMKRGVIERLTDLGIGLFRINLSHTKLEHVGPSIEMVRQRTPVPICLDTEGAQIRTGDFAITHLELIEHSIVRAHAREVAYDGKNFNFHPRDIVRQFQIGDFISIDFNAVLVRVIAVENDGDTAVMRVITGGIVGRNKAVTVDREIRLPALSEKDEAALSIGREFGVRHVALSFANCGNDVDAVRKVIGSEASVISKIECVNGLRNIDDIARKSNALLIDRGDLSRQVPIEQIPSAQKQIIERAHTNHVKAYVATNLLESMVTSPLPTRAEINDIYNTLLDGADGLVLAAETAIGAYPVRCASMIAKLIAEFEKPRAVLVNLPRESISLLAMPHGGALVNREATEATTEILESLPRLVVDDFALNDAQQICDGTYSPLEGFMGRETLKAVLFESRLPSGLPWPVPIVLPVSKADAVDLTPGILVALAGSDRVVRFLMEVEEVFELGRLLTTVSPSDVLGRDFFPGSQRLKSSDWLVAGKITKASQGPSSRCIHALSPSQVRFIFSNKGWSRIVAFHASTPALCVDEHVQLHGLEQTGADGLFVLPAIDSRVTKGSYSARTISDSYSRMMELGVYPAGRVVLGGLLATRFGNGPREIIRAALCSKNMGCSHFILNAVQMENLGGSIDEVFLFVERLGLHDIGVELVSGARARYEPRSRNFTEGKRQSSEEAAAWRAFREGEPVPDWFMRPEIQEAIGMSSGSMERR